MKAFYSSHSVSIVYSFCCFCCYCPLRQLILSKLYPFLVNIVYISLHIVFSLYFISMNFYFLWNTGSLLCLKLFGAVVLFFYLSFSFLFCKCVVKPHFLFFDEILKMSIFPVNVPPPNRTTTTILLNAILPLVECIEKRYNEIKSNKNHWSSFRSFLLNAFISMLFAGK